MTSLAALTYAGLTDEAGVIFISSRENLNHSLNLVFSADNGVNLALLRLGSEVVTELVEGRRLALALLAALRILTAVSLAV